MCSCDETPALAGCTHISCTKGHRGLLPRQVQQGQGLGPPAVTPPAPGSQGTRVAEGYGCAGWGEDQDDLVSGDSGDEEMLGACLCSRQECSSLWTTDVWILPAQALCLPGLMGLDVFNSIKAAGT